MFEIGDSLREARTRRGLSAEDVQKGIRIRERYLTALEDERWELLPGEAYAKGFLRTYAEFLGLDGGLYIDEFNARIARPDEEPLLVPESLSTSHRRRGALRTLFGILAIGAAIAAIAAWGSGSPAPKAAAAPHAQQHQVVRAAPIAKVVAPEATRASTVRTSITAARGTSWLSIRTDGPAGAVLYQGTLAQGTALHYTLGGHRLWVRMGRPGVLDITVGGHRIGGLPANPANVLLTRRGAQAA